MIRHLEIEPLEDRVTPTVVFTPHPWGGVSGAEIITQRNQDQVLSNPNVYLIFDGPYWTGTQGQQDVDTLRNAASSILGGPYLRGLRQYGNNNGVGLAQYRYSVVNPPGTAFTAEPSATDLQSYLQGVVGWSAFLPPPDYNGQPAIYVVVTSPGVVGQTAAGYNTQGQWVDPATHQAQPINMAWVSTNWISTFSLSGGRLVKHASVDWFTQVLSHEIAEDISDPGGKGIHVAPPANLPSSLKGDDQIGDNEPAAQRYSYRLNGYLVQPYWSDNDKAFIVPDGNKQKFLLQAHWNDTAATFDGTYDWLDVEGDQLGANYTDVINLYTSSTTGGVQVKMNNEFTEFDYGVIRQVHVTTWGGRNGVWAESLPANTSLYVDSYGSGSDDYVTVGTGSIEQVQGRVNVRNDFGQTHLTVIANASPGRSIDISNGSVNVDYGAASITYESGFTNNGYHGVVGIEVWGGLGAANSFSVENPGLQTVLTLHGGPKGDSFYIGGFQGVGMVNIDNRGNYDQIAVDDRYSDDAGGAYYQFQYGTLSRIVGSNTARVNFVAAGVGTASFHESLALYPFAGAAVSFFGTLSGFPATVYDYNGASTVTVYYTGIFDTWSYGAPVTVVGNGGNSKLVVEDSLATQAEDYTLTSTTAGRTGSPVSYSNVAAVELNGGQEADTFHVLGTAADITTALNGGPGGNQFLVSDPNTTLDSIQGPLALHGQGSAGDAAVFDDSGNPADQTYTLTATSLDRSGMATIAFDGLTSVTLKAGLGNDTVALGNLAAGPAFALDGGSGSNTLDYSAYPGDAVVDPAAGTATGVAGGISNFQNLKAGPGNSLLPDAGGKIHIDASLTAIAGAFAVVEGGDLSGVLASFIDADPAATADLFSASIDWGDGTGSAGSVVANGQGGFDVEGDHTYVEKGSYRPTVSINDQGGSTADVTATVQVSDAPLTLQGTNLSGVKGQDFAGVSLATFTDANRNAQPGDFAATIDWGDGTTAAATITANADGSFSVIAGSHVYTGQGSFTIGVTVEDAGGASATAQTAAFVDAVTGAGTTVTTVASSAVTGPVASFTSADPNAQAGDFSAVILWDTGAASDTNVTIAYDGASQSFLVSGNHTYTVAGSHDVKVSIVHTGGATADVETVVNVSPAAASMLAVTGPSSTTPGVAQAITVTALDPFGNVATGYTGAVHLSSSDVQTGVSQHYAFAAGDQGIHTFSVVLKTAGNQTVRAADSSGTVASGQASIAVTPAAASTLLLKGFPSAISAGVAGSFTVTARDAFGNTATGYTGKVHFGSSDLAALLPADYTFTAADQGIHAFKAALKTAGTQSLGAADAAAKISTVQSGILVDAAVSFSLSGLPTKATAGTAVSVTVTALNASGQKAVNYRGTIRFSSSDGRAVLASPYMFTATDQGVHTFQVVLKTAGSQSLVVTDTGLASVTGRASVLVTSGVAKTLVITGLSSSIKVGATATFTVTALDAYGNVATGYTGTVGFASSDKKGVLPAKYTFTVTDKGVHTFTVVFKTAGTQSLTIADTVVTSLTTTRGGIQVA